jgi:hypothetical protein
MSSLADDLRNRLVDAYPSYVEGRVAAQQLEPPEALVEALEEGVSWLQSTLEDLLARPYAAQHRGPLEVFQEAMRFPTEVLSAAGVEPPRRDGGAEAALPGDLFDLAPASSRQIGEEVWLAHLAWGADKARQISRTRSVVLLSRNLMDRARIEPVVVGSGAELSRFAADLTDPLPDLLVVDLEHEDAVTALERYTGAGVPAVAFGPHAARDLLDEARRLGAEVVVRSAFFSDLGLFLT